MLVPAEAGDHENIRLRALAKQAEIELYPVTLRAPPLRLPTLEGGTLGNGDLKGKIALLSFWASWCATCKAEFSSLERLQAMFERDEFQVVAIAVLDAPDTIKRFLGTRPPRFPILLDADRKVADQYRAAGVPVAYLLDRDGRIVAGKSGEHRWDDPASVALVRCLLTGGKP